jgi:hypothetical protein
VQGAVKLAYAGCGRAMVQSWGVIGVGLAAFALSSFIPTFRFGALMIGLLTVGLIGNLLFLPALLAGPIGQVIASSIRRRRAAAAQTALDDEHEESIEAEEAEPIVHGRRVAPVFEHDDEDSEVPVARA